MKSFHNHSLLVLAVVLACIGTATAQSRTPRRPRVDLEQGGSPSRPDRSGPRVPVPASPSDTGSSGGSLPSTKAAPTGPAIGLRPRPGLARPATPGGLGRVPAGAARPGGGGAVDLAGGTQLSNTYRGNDGGAFYVRTLQNQVHLFGEHPGLKYALVFEGTRNGSLISGSYWDVPKGQRTLAGNLTLRIESNGQKLVVQSASGGLPLNYLESFAIPANQLPTAHRPPGFTTASASDLDGAWRSGNHSLYIREVGGQIVAWEEHAFAAGQKPAVAQVLVGTRTGASGVSLDFVALPKGLATSHGTRSYVIDDAFHLRQLGGSTWVRDVVDLNKFGEEIVKRFKDRCVGFGYSIAHEGNLVKSGGWGQRLLASDGGPLPFTADTQKDTQSTAKTITAAAVMHLLHVRGMSVEEKIAPWLPKYWIKGKNVELLTFKDLLTHRSGLVDYGDPDEYQNLKQTIATGPVDRNWIVPQYEYRNANFAMFRIILPYLEQPSDMHNFEDNGIRGSSLNERCSKRYRDYVRDHVLLPAGLANPQPDYTSNDRAYSYNFQQQNVAGYPQQAGQLYEMGAGSWVVSARDYTRFLTALDNGLILPSGKVAEMKSKGLGLFAISSGIGTAYQHGGSIGGGADGAYGSGRGARAHHIMFPNKVQVYITINSANNLEPAESSQARGEALRDAFNAALY